MGMFFVFFVVVFSFVYFDCFWCYFVSDFLIYICFQFRPWRKSMEILFQSPQKSPENPPQNNAKN